MCAVEYVIKHLLSQPACLCVLPTGMTGETIHFRRISRVDLDALSHSLIGGQRLGNYTNILAGAVKRRYVFRYILVVGLG